jgi:hypothetical protein
MVDIVHYLYSTQWFWSGVVKPIVGKYLSPMVCPSEGHPQNSLCSRDGHHNDLPNGVIYMISDQVWCFQLIDSYVELIHQVPKNIHLKLVVSTAGGYYIPCFHLVRHLKQHSAGYTVYVYDQCLSAGTFMALGAREIVMNPYSKLSKIDSVDTPEKEPDRYAKDYTREDISFSEYVKVRSRRDWICYVEDELRGVISDKIYATVRDLFIRSALPHVKCFYYEECLKTGLQVRRPKEDEYKYFRWV